MNANLVIVESPAKAKTIEKFLGKDFKVTSSYGHVRDLKSKSISIDFEHGYEPVYEVPDEKKKTVSELKKLAAGSQTVWLASDEDREGEAIAWHLSEVLGLDGANTRRIVFHEITKPAILAAIENPRTIDLNLVNAQQARRVLDRIMGYELSPILWTKIKGGLSAGRVQSVAVRLIVEREREISRFKAEAAYRAVAHFTTASGAEIEAEYEKRFPTAGEARAFLESCDKSEFSVDSISVKPARRSPAPPFTTSTLQQEAARKLGFPVQVTMMVAQRLYESGMITYMRTDSVNLSSLAIGAAKQVITDEMGAKYSRTRAYATKTKGAQEAHEAIRPTDLSRRHVEGQAQDKALYDLIWKRTIASQMADAQLERTELGISGSGLKGHFKAVGEVVIFDGFLRVYNESRDDDRDEQGSKLLPRVAEGEKLGCGSVRCEERYSRPPARYTEASLVRKMEELGIGRPSTYAPTISTILNRGYVEKSEPSPRKRSLSVLKLEGGKISESKVEETIGADKNKLVPTDIGSVVNDYLVENFSEVVDFNFTADVERELDHVAAGQMEWQDAIDGFYKSFHPLVEEARTARSEHKVGERLIGTDPVSGKEIYAKIGRYGPVVQKGSVDGDEKPQFAPMPKGKSIETITLEEAVSLFKLPCTIGTFEGGDVKCNVGRFGPYVQHGGKFYSLPKGTDPLSVSLDEAIEIINAKREAEQKKLVKSFEQDPGLQILNGRYGKYIAKDKQNYKIPKDMTAEDLSYEDCLKIIEEAASKPAKKSGGRWKRKSS